jgi:hypothetical protein
MNKEEYEKEKQIALKKVNISGVKLYDLSSGMQDDRDVVLAAVKNAGIALMYASHRLRKDREIVLAAVKSSGKALYYAAEKFKNDKEIVLAAVDQNYRAFEYASSRLQRDKDVLASYNKTKGKWKEYKELKEKYNNDCNIYGALVNANSGKSLREQILREQKRLSELEDELKFVKDARHEDVIKDDTQLDKNLDDTKKSEKTIAEPNKKSIPTADDKSKSLNPALNEPYAVFKKGNTLCIVSSFINPDDPALVDIYNQIKEKSKLAQETGIDHCFLINNVSEKNNNYTLNDPNQVINVSLDANGNYVVNPDDVDAVEYYNQKTNNKQLSTDDKKGNPNLEKLDKNPMESAIPAESKKVENRRHAKSELFEKFKKMAKKIAPIAAVIALAMTTGEVVSRISNYFNSSNSQTTTTQNSSVDDNSLDKATDESNSNYGDRIQNIVWGDNVGEGDIVYVNAADASSQQNQLTANEYFRDNPVDVYNNKTGWMHLTQQQLNDLDYMNELAKDSDNSILFGDSLENPSGFENLAEVMTEVNQKLTQAGGGRTL